MSKVLRLDLKELFARALEQPSREKFRDVLANHTGEQDFVDFKAEWPKWPKLAKHILALANSGGGSIIIGVRERDDKALDIRGIESFTDKAEITSSVEKFVPHEIAYAVHDFDYVDSEYPTLIGKKFQLLTVGYEPELIPFLSVADGDGIASNRIYARSGTRSEEASHDKVQEILSERIRAGSSALQSGKEIEEHLTQLEALCSHQLPYGYDVIPDELWPKSRFYKFVDTMIRKKMRLVKRILEVE